MAAPAADKAYLEIEGGDPLHCLFNPESLQVSIRTSWEGDRTPGIEAPQVEWRGGESGTMKLDLLFDTSRKGEPVTDHTDRLIKLLKVDPNLPGYSEAKQNGRPPWVIFHWGKFHSFKAVVTDLDLRFTYFSSSGEPLRANASLTLKQYAPEPLWPAQNPTSGTPLPARSHQVQPGETLDRVAARYYDDPTAWRQVAQANGIRDPFNVRPGTRVDVPTVEA